MITSECSLKRIGNTAVIFCGCQIHEFVSFRQSGVWIRKCGDFYLFKCGRDAVANA